jgi:hypothetical protein
VVGIRVSFSITIEIRLVKELPVIHSSNPSCRTDSKTASTTLHAACSQSPRGELAIARDSLVIFCWCVMTCPSQLS